MAERAPATVRIQPRWVRLDAAAVYCGVSKRLFLDQVKSGMFPKPHKLNSCSIWDTFELDEVMAALPREGNGKHDWGDSDSI